METEDQKSGVAVAARSALKNILSWRIFWYANLQQDGTGYWMHEWTNHVTGRRIPVFAGYNRRALNSTKSTFPVAKDRFLTDEQ